VMTFRTHPLSQISGYATATRCDFGARNV